MSNISLNAPSLQHVLGFSYYISSSAMIEKNKVKIWTPSPPRVALNYWITLSKYLCKITQRFQQTTLPLSNSFHWKLQDERKLIMWENTAIREGFLTVGLICGLSKVNIYLWYLRRTHARINWPRFWTTWMSLDPPFPPLCVKIHNVYYMHCLIT